MGVRQNKYDYSPAESITNMVHDKLNLFAGDVGHRLWMLNPFLQNRRMVQLMRHHLKYPIPLCGRYVLQSGLSLRQSNHCTTRCDCLSLPQLSSQILYGGFNLSRFQF